MYKQTFNPCDECQYSYSSTGEESSTCKICEFADLLKQKHGEWIERIETLSWCEDDVEVYYDCSLCGAHSPGESSYCPNCGAKMIGLSMTKCEACGCYIITADDMKMLRDTNYGHADPVGEPGVEGVDGELPHWIKIPTDRLIEDHDRVCWKCSVCGKETDLPNYEKANFCFNCGARMIKE